MKNETDEKNKCYINRELSWLKFNDRVLEEAADEENPLCERLSFLSIFQTNLDEFFMVRVGSLHDMQFLKKEVRDNKTGMTPQEQIEAILQTTALMARRKDQVYMDLMGLLTDQGIRVVSFSALNDIEKKQLERYFEQEIKPLLSTIIVGKKQPFPFLQNREIYAVAVLETRSDKAKIGIIPCASRVFDRLVPVPGRSGYYMLAEELILHFLPMVFDKYRVQEKSLIRITRNADIDADALYDDDLDYREFMVQLIKRRKRLAPVRLELSRELDGIIIDTLCRYMDVPREYVFQSATPLDLSFLFGIQDFLRQRSELFYQKRIPQKSPSFVSGRPILAQIREKDKLLSYPYESMRPFLEMLTEAANDDSVVSIKMTLYRVAKQSKVVEALCEAAENGKDVLVLVELKARFDEENNIEWSRRLEEAGCNVIYGLDGYKVHSKLCLITRREELGVAYYTQIGTGNYNEKTARLYTDLCLMTADHDIGEEANAVFNALAKGETVHETRRLLVAPHCLQNKVLAMMDDEIRRARAGEEAYIGVKINSLTDKAIIDKLIEASCAGVKVDLVVRGICCLIAGVPEATENIRVVSIVGRFLEHSRIYIFGRGERAKVYIASADFMTRNTLRRVEVASPVMDADIRARILSMFDTMLRDNMQAREMDAQGQYHRLTPGESEPLSSQEYFFKQAYDAVSRVVISE